MLASLLLNAALAAPPEVQVLSDGRTVQGIVQVAAAPDDVRAVLLDPWATARTAGSDLVVEKLADAGTCADYRWTVPNAIKTVSYSARLCPTETGVLATLLQSEDMEEYRAEWWVEADPGGSRLRYEVRSWPSFPLPAAIVRSQVAREVRKMLQGFQASLGG